MIVDAGNDRLLAQIGERVLEREDCAVFLQADDLLVLVGDAGWAFEGLGKGYGVLVGNRGPLARVEQGIRGTEFVGGGILPAEDADADLDEGIARFGVVIADGAFVRAELFDRAGDGVVQERIVRFVVPLAEEGMALVGQAGDDAGPIKPGGSVVAVLSVWKKQDGGGWALGDGCLGVVGVGQVRAGGRGDRESGWEQKTCAEGKKPRVPDANRMSEPETKYGVSSAGAVA